jgi:ketosteroid isomerase-like protein
VCISVLSPLDGIVDPAQQTTEQDPRIDALAKTPIPSGGTTDKSMNQTDPQLVALEFVARINARDVDALAELMTEDHEFIDTDGTSFRGRENLRSDWHGYYAMFPDYHIEIDQVSSQGGLVILTGSSSGTLSPEGEEALRNADGSLPPDEELQGPAIWTGRIEDGLVAQWRVYFDTPTIRAELGLAEKT